MQHISLFTDFDIALFKAGKHFRLYEKFGAHFIEHDELHGVYFAVWAPNAASVSVIGDFNNWDPAATLLTSRWDHSGIWEGFIPMLEAGAFYKYHIVSNNGYIVDKTDPFAFQMEEPPNTASKTCAYNYTWGDDNWVESRSRETVMNGPLSVYELHIGSWRRNADGQFLTYRELAEQLPQYCKYMGFTHVELMPVMEHPFYGSWGYQVTGYFAPSSRYGSPEDFMYLIDMLHQAGIGVILDWVPSHFPTDEHGLGYFDGTHLYEHEDGRIGFHPDWKSFIFNYGRHEVQSYLISNALYWLDKYHIDGLRVDAVASMLYLDYSRNDGEWVPNEHGGRENLMAVQFLRTFNDAVHTYHTDVITIAEESTAWPGVTVPVTSGGLGFDLKWMMGWMHDTLSYFSREPLYRSYHQHQMTFSLVYAFSERFMLPLSHDEVVHGKRSLLEKMPGDDWQKFANLRLLYSYMYCHPGAKMIFMGGEFAQSHEWRHDFSLDWHENDRPANRGIQTLVKELNYLYRTEAALHDYNYSSDGFQWIDIQDNVNSVLIWMRKSSRGEKVVVIANLTPVPRLNYRLGVPDKGVYTEIFNSDAQHYGGSNVVNKRKSTYPIGKHGYRQSLSVTLPPLGLIVFKQESQ
jgi:1,4-alpha-glucan branching enzyme